MMLKIWRDFLNTGITNMPKLYIIGKRGWNNSDVFTFLDHCIALKPYLFELTDAPDRTVITTLNQSKAALFPSYGEGWGLPPVESLALGVPTVCSDIPVLREATKGYATYIHPDDYFGWRNMILELSQISSENMSAWKNNLRSFSPVVWSASFEKLRLAITDGIFEN